MRYEDMTLREQRLSKTALCPLCHERIEIIQDVQIVKMKYGKRVILFYIHSACLLNSIVSSQLDYSREEVINEATE